MAENITIARPYARAVFEEATESNQFSEWLQILKNLSLAISDRELVTLCENPQTDLTKLSELLTEVAFVSLPVSNSKLQDRMNNFVKILTEAKRLAVIPGILEVYQEMLAERERITAVTVISAAPIADVLRLKIQNVLERKFDSKVSIEYQQDKTLIGGAIIRAGNRVIDGSIRGKLMRMADEMGV